MNNFEEKLDDLVFRCFAQGQYWGTASGVVNGEESDEFNPDYEPENPIDRTEAVGAIKQLILDEVIGENDFEFDKKSKERNILRDKQRRIVNGE